MNRARSPFFLACLCATGFAWACSTDKANVAGESTSGAAGDGATARGGSAESGGSSASGAGPVGSGGSDSAAGGQSAGNSGGTAVARGGAAGSTGSAGSAGALTSGASSGGALVGGAGATSKGGSSTAGAAGASNRGGSAGGGAGGSAGSSAAGAAGGEKPDVIATIHNGGFWTDTAGNRIEAHGAGLLRVDDTWYWFGEDKSGNSSAFKAVNCYASKDFQNWEFRRAVLTRGSAATLDAADRIIERPKVIFNDKTKKFVMWLHFEGKDYAEAAAGVFTSDTVDGEYAFESSFRPNGNMSRDDTLFKDDDGKAYFVSAANNNADLVLYELSDDYLGVKRQVLTLWAGSSREAPALFKQGGRYYLVNSAATGWDSNQAKYASATAIGGPWSALSNLGDATTFDTQPSYLIPIQGSRVTTYVYAGDRWQDPDLKSSKYIWLPLKINGAALSLDYYAEWLLNLSTGSWSLNDGFIPQGDWTLLAVDSQETAGEDGAATNAFDDSPSTYWHTEWQARKPEHPHEIRIDLGARYAVTGFRYLPRQDKDDFGMVADYEVYLSESATDFGAAVASGKFGAGKAATQLSFAAKLGRYLRFVALSEINGSALTSVAELDLVGVRK